MITVLDEQLKNQSSIWTGIYLNRKQNKKNIYLFVLFPILCCVTKAEGAFAGGVEYKGQHKRYTEEYKRHWNVELKA